MNVWGYLGIGILVVAGFILLLAFLYNLGMVWFASRYSGKTIEKHLKKLEDVLPGTDCGACGCESCKAYAYAVFTCHMDADRCTPGGPAVEARLSAHMDDFQKVLAGEDERKDRGSNLEM